MELLGQPELKKGGDIVSVGFYHGSTFDFSNSIRPEPTGTIEQAIYTSLLFGFYDSFIRRYCRIGVQWPHAFGGTDRVIAMTFLSGLASRISSRHGSKDDAPTFLGVILLPLIMLAASITAAVQSPIFAEVLQDMSENLPNLILP